MLFSVVCGFNNFVGYSGICLGVSYWSMDSLFCMFLPHQLYSCYTTFNFNSLFLWPAFVLKHTLVASAVFGATKLWQLQEVLDACQVELNPEIIADVDKVHTTYPNPCPWSNLDIILLIPHSGIRFENYRYSWMVFVSQMSCHFNGPVSLGGSFRDSSIDPKAVIL